MSKFGLGFKSNKGKKMKDDPTKDHTPIWGKDGSQVLFKERYPVVLKTYEKWKSLNPLLEKYIRQQVVYRPIGARCSNERVF